MLNYTESTSYFTMVIGTNFTTTGSASFSSNSCAASIQSHVPRNGGSIMVTNISAGLVTSQSDETLPCIHELLLGSSAAEQDASVSVDISTRTFLRNQDDVTTGITARANITADAMLAQNVYVIEEILIFPDVADFNFAVPAWDDIVSRVANKIEEEASIYEEVDDYDYDVMGQMSGWLLLAPMTTHLLNFNLPGRSFTSHHELYFADAASSRPSNIACSSFSDYEGTRNMGTLMKNSSNFEHSMECRYFHICFFFWISSLNEERQFFVSNFFYFL